MSLYIDKKNQSYLWETVTNHPKFEPYLKGISMKRFAEWFRSIIEGFYLKWGQRPMNQEELKQMNRNTISYMYQNLSGTESVPSAMNQDPMTVIQSQANPMMPQVSANYASQVFGQKPVQVLPEFSGQYEYQKRSESYEQMTAKPSVPPMQGKTDSDKRESQDAMERRILEEQKQREMDIQLFSPPSQIGGKQAVNLNLLKMNNEMATTENASTNSEIVEIRNRIENRMENRMENREEENIHLVIRDSKESVNIETTSSVIKQEPMSEIKSLLDEFRQFRQIYSQTNENIEKLTQEMHSMKQEMDQKMLKMSSQFQKIEKEVKQTSQLFSPFLVKPTNTGTNNTTVSTIANTNTNGNAKRKSTIPKEKEMEKETRKEKETINI